MKDIGVDKEAIRSYLLTFLFPICGLFYSFNNWTEKHSKNIFWMFCSFTGFIFIFQPEGTVLGVGADSGRYALSLISMHEKIHSISDFIAIFKTGLRVDFYEPIITFIVSRFTDNPHWLFWVFATIYGFFYSRNIWFVLERLPSIFSNFFWILIGFYILVCPIWNINGARMWTALQVFVYGAMPYLLNNDNRKLIWCLITPLIHFSFFIPLITIVLYKVIPLKNKINLFFIFYIISLFINSIDITFISDIIQRIPFLESRQTYFSDTYIESLLTEKDNLSLHVVIANFISHWGTHILIFFTYAYYIKNKHLRCAEVNRLLSFALLLFGVSNILSVVPSGSRFIVLSKMFMLPVIIYISVMIGKTAYKQALPFKFMQGIILLLLFSVIFQIRTSFDYYGTMLVFGNFITAPFITSDIPLIEFVKDIL